MIVKKVLADFEKVKNATCFSCREKDPVVIVGLYNVEYNELGLLAYCKDCFKEEYPDYTLEGNCMLCKKNFNCSTQKKLFSAKEIRAFKKQFWAVKVKDVKLEAEWNGGYT